MSMIHAGAGTLNKPGPQVFSVDNGRALTNGKDPKFQTA